METQTACTDTLVHLARPYTIWCTVPSLIRAFPTLLLSWLTTGFAAAVGSMVGNAAGPRGLKAGAIAGGVLGLLVAITVARRRAWLPAALARGAFLGGLVGFAVAVLLTLTHMHTPVIPVLSCGLVGIGTLVGAGVARGWAAT